MDFIDYVADKEWVCEDEVIKPLLGEDIKTVEDGNGAVKDRFGNLMAKWMAPESYIPEVTFREAQEDEDVCVGDIELEDGFIFLMDNRDNDWE